MDCGNILLDCESDKEDAPDHGLGGTGSLVLAAVQERSEVDQCRTGK